MHLNKHSSHKLFLLADSACYICHIYHEIVTHTRVQYHVLWGFYLKLNVGLIMISKHICGFRIQGDKDRARSLTRRK